MVVACNNKICNFEIDGFCGKEMIAIQFNGGCSEFFDKHGQRTGNGSYSINDYKDKEAKDRVKIVDAEEADLRAIDQELPHIIKSPPEEKEEADASEG